MVDGLLLLLMLEADRGRTVTVVDGLSISTKTHSLQCGASKPSESDGERERGREGGRIKSSGTGMPRLRVILSGTVGTCALGGCR